MASHGSRSPSPLPSPSRRRMKTCARRCERVCCAVATYFPLAFIYSLTGWAVWVDAGIGFHKTKPDEQIPYSQKIPSIVGVVLWLLLNVSYTKAVFTDPGSPANSNPSQRRGKYSVLPTSEPTNDLSDVQTITVSSSGSARYCKKCHVAKPDRAHHCSTCKRCVLKMDHHCPWLATCLGLHNYKAFILFLVYTSLFCWACFYNSAIWVYIEIFASPTQHFEQFAPVNVIMLAVLSGIIGLVLTGFTAWHLYLCTRGQTTIECLEKTRYLSGVRRQVEQNRQERMSHSRDDSEGLSNNLKRARDQILEFHANAVPGASRFEEGEEHVSPAVSVDRDFDSQFPSRNTSQHQQNQSPNTMPSNSESPAQRALRHNYSDIESRRDQDRYEEYLDEKETSSLPNAFDLGWRKNLAHVFGPNPMLWWLPVSNTTGDGWRWEVSSKWMEAQEEVARRKEERLQNAAAQQNYNQNHSQFRGQGQRYKPHLRGGNSTQYYDQEGYDYDRDAEHNQGSSHFQQDSTSHYGRSDMSMQTLHHQRRSPRNTRRDFDDTGEDGEVASFEVSGSEAEGDSESDSGPDSDFEDGRGDHRRQHQRVSRPGQENEEWGREW